LTAIINKISIGYANWFY